MEALATQYGLFFIAAFIAYVVFYVLPLGRGFWDLRVSKLDRLVNALNVDMAEVTTEGRPELARATAPPVLEPALAEETETEHDHQPGISDALFTEIARLTVEAQTASIALYQTSTSLAYAEILKVMREMEDARIIGPDTGGPEREVLVATQDELDDILGEWLDEEEEEETVTSPQRWAAERLSRLDGLQGEYNGVVQEALDQVRSQYPDGAYQRFEIERLPTVAAFSERVGAARTMAGLFVLIGLFFTMIRLNGVVSDIADAAGGDTQEPQEFLESMGNLMDGIGGAFDSSIYGLGLLVLALLIVGGIDWLAQRRILMLEKRVTGEVIPILSRIHDRLRPNLTLADLLADTGAHLDRLGKTVGGLTGELDNSLDKLGGRIGTMIEEFGSFTKQYDQLNSLLVHMKKASESLSNASGVLEGSARRIGDPLSQFNKSVLSHVETVVDWAEISREGFARLSDEMAATREHSDRLVEALARAAEDGFGETLREHHDAIAEIGRQAAGVETRLAALSRALEGSGDGANTTPPVDA